VLALDRLVLAQKPAVANAATEPRLNQLFKQAQSVPDFRPADFAAALIRFDASLTSHP
jgi:hypothetical protein